MFHHAKRLRTTPRFLERSIWCKQLGWMMYRHHVGAMIQTLDVGIYFYLKALEEDEYGDGKWVEDLYLSGKLCTWKLLGAALAYRTIAMRFRQRHNLEVGALPWTF
jgi:hypothetical protein